MGWGRGRDTHLITATGDKTETSIVQATAVSHSHPKANNLLLLFPKICSCSSQTGFLTSSWLDREIYNKEISTIYKAVRQLSPSSLHAPGPGLSATQRDWVLSAPEISGCSASSASLHPMLILSGRFNQDFRCHSKAFPQSRFKTPSCSCFSCTLILTWGW